MLTPVTFQVERRALRAQSHTISRDMSKQFPDDLDYWNFRFSLGLGVDREAPLFQLYSALKHTFQEANNA